MEQTDARIRMGLYAVVARPFVDNVVTVVTARLASTDAPGQSSDKIAVASG